MKKLLVCIPFYYSEDRLQYLKQVIDNLNRYELDVTIIISSNVRVQGTVFAPVNVVFLKFGNLSHPFHLTWVHRQQMVEDINHYDYYYYCEDDMLLPWENFKNYIDTFDLMWPSWVPGLVRVETGPDGKLYNTDAINAFQPTMLVNIDGQEYGSLMYPYHAQWIMPREALKESMRGNFVRLEDNRELAASYPMWEVGKTALVKLKDGQVDPVCYTYHLPNNYALSPDSPFGKIEINKILV